MNTDLVTSAAKCLGALAQLQRMGHLHNHAHKPSHPYKANPKYTRIPHTSLTNN